MFDFKTIVWGSIFMLAALIIGPWIAVQFDTSFPVIDIGGIRYVGIIILAGGIILSLYCSAILFLPKKGNAPKPYDMQHEFIVMGPYEYVRNPFLLGIIIALFGETILMSSFAMIAYTFLATLCTHFFVVFFEEPELSDRYGDEYKRYSNAIPRWFPQFRKYSS